MISEYTDSTLNRVDHQIEIHTCAHDTHDHKPLANWTGEVLARISEIQFEHGEHAETVEYQLWIELAALAVMRAESMQRVTERRQSGDRKPYRCLTCGYDFLDAGAFEVHRDLYRVS